MKLCASSPAAVSVSYTHLDVYKRQVLPFSTSFALLHRQVLFVDPYSIAGAFFLQTLDDEIVPFVLFHPHYLFGLYNIFQFYRLESHVGHTAFI